MCGIAGFVNYKKNMLNDYDYNKTIAQHMADAIRHRGPDADGVWIGENTAFSHARLAVIDVEGGKQPMVRNVGGYEFAVTYNGELYNTWEIKRELLNYGYHFSTTSDTEVLLYAYIHYGDKCVEKLNGIYAFCVWDSMRQRVFLCRDRFGVKPLFYSVQGDTLVFGSEQKAMFEYPAIKPAVDLTGLQEIFAMSPARTPGNGVFKGIDELRPAHYMVFSRSGLKIQRYWQLSSHEHTDSYQETIEKVHDLVTDSIKRQLVSDVPIGTLLSGGLDSSIISAVAAKYMQEQGKQLATYSFDYTDNEQYFQKNSFQPDTDRPWVERMVEVFRTKHTYLECDNDRLIKYLLEAVWAKDLPGMADVDASLMYFCECIKPEHTVILSGECADEIFGGYPWFHSDQAFSTHGFPWSYDMSLRGSILRDDIAAALNLQEYSTMRYEQSIAEVPAYSGDSVEEKRRREIAYLNINWFMANLLDRKDRFSMAGGLEVRVPFCDHRLVEYVWNIPWKMKNKDNIPKNILREAARNILPEDVLMREKTPYPKTYNPGYEKQVKALLSDIISDPNAPILTFADKNKLETLISGSGDYGKPFFGQLMAYPQFIGYIVQINEWLRRYRIKIW